MHIHTPLPLNYDRRWVIIADVIGKKGERAQFPKLDKISNYSCYLNGSVSGEVVCVITESNKACCL